MSEIRKISVEEVEIQIKEIQADYSYRIVDLTIGELMKKFRKKEDEILVDEEFSVLIVPNYQRNFIWSKNMQSKFIESIFMGVPIQPLFAFELDEDGDLELLDGVQRLSSIKDFFDNKLILSDLEELDTLNGYQFSDLETSRKRKFSNKPLKFFIINENTDEGVRADIFRRVNEGGKKLEPAEIRKGKFINNEFYNFILSCTELPEFNALFSATKNDDKSRGEKEELITRFFAYSDDYNNFQHSVKGFLDNYIINQGKTFTNQIGELKKGELLRMLKFVEENISNGFRKTDGSKSIPRVRFEAISIGTNLALRKNPQLINPETKWLNSVEFKQTTTSDAANNKSKVVARIEFVRDCLLSKIDINSLQYEN